MPPQTNGPSGSTGWTVLVECEVGAGSCTAGTLTVYARCLKIN